MKIEWANVLHLKCTPTHHRVCSNHFSSDSVLASGRLKMNSVPLAPVLRSERILNTCELSDHNYGKKYQPSTEASIKSKYYQLLISIFN